MDTYNQASNQSLQNLNKIKQAITPIERPDNPIEAYLRTGVQLPKVSETGTFGFLGKGVNFLGSIGQDILNIPSNLIGGTQQIISGDVSGGLGRVGQGGLDLATTLLTGGAGKGITKGAQKVALGGALKGLEGQAIKQAGKQILRKEVTKGALGGAAIGAGYGLSGALKDLNQIPLEKQTDFIMGNIITGGAIGGLTGGLFTYAGAKGAINEINKLEEGVLKNIATKNYDELVKAPLDKKGNYVIDLIDEDIKKASLQAISGKQQGWFGKTFKPAQGLGEGMQNAFTNWVNTRNSTGALSMLKFKEFRDYVDKGIQGIIDFERDASKFPGLKEYFDGMQKVLAKAGILKEAQYFDKVNYLPLLFNNSKEEIAAAFQRKRLGQPVEKLAGETLQEYEKRRALTMKPSFAFERVINSYNEGISVGLTPKFNNIAELVGWYERTARKAIADRNFFTELVNNKWVVPSRKAPSDWVELGTGFPRFTSRTKEGFLEDRYAAPPELAEVINNYLAQKDKGFLGTTARFFDGVKQRILTTGIPFTGINFHGISTSMRYIFKGGKNPVTSIFQAINFLTNPGAARKNFAKSLELLPEAVKAGLIVSEKAPKLVLYTKEQLRKEFEAEFKDAGFLKRNFGRAWEMYKSAVEDPLMENIIPAYKLETWKNTYNTYKAYMPDDMARKKAAEFTNNLLGGLNYDEMGRSPEVRNLMKFLLLAPDWFETNVTLGKRVLQSLWDKDKNYRAYRNFIVNFMSAYVFMNAINKTTSGHYMWENEPGQKFSIDTGTYDEQGNKRYIQIFGTGADFVRLPVDVIDGLYNDDTAVISRLARNRLSPLGSTLVSLFSNTDYAGRPLFGTDKFGNSLSAQQQLLGATSLVGQAVGIPTIFGEPIRNIAESAVTGKPISLEKTLVQAADLPVRYKAEVSDLTKMQRQRTADRKSLEQAIINNDVVTASSLSQNFTQREINSIVSGILEKNVNSQLTTREKIFNRLSDQQKLELARTNPEFNTMYQKINQLKTEQESSPINNYKELLVGKPTIKKPKVKKPRRLRARKVRAKKPRVVKVKKLRIKKLQTIKSPNI